MAHWAARIKNSTNLEDIWTYRVACYWQGVDEERCRKAARICIEQGCGVWHAVSVVTGRMDDCPCVPCRKAKGLQPIQF
jgi:hypothetical protein